MFFLKILKSLQEFNFFFMQKHKPFTIYLGYPRKICTLAFLHGFTYICLKGKERQSSPIHWFISQVPITPVVISGQCQEPELKPRPRVNGRDASVVGGNSTYYTSMLVSENLKRF